MCVPFKPLDKPQAQTQTYHKTSEQDIQKYQKFPICTHSRRSGVSPPVEVEELVALGRSDFTASF